MSLCSIDCSPMPCIRRPVSHAATGAWTRFASALQAKRKYKPMGRARNPGLRRAAVFGTLPNLAVRRKTWISSAPHGLVFFFLASCSQGQSQQLSKSNIKSFWSGFAHIVVTCVHLSIDFF